MRNAPLRAFVSPNKLNKNESPAKFRRTGPYKPPKSKIGKGIHNFMEKGIKGIIGAGYEAYKNPKSAATGLAGLKNKKSSPTKKLSRNCINKAKAKFDVYPSAYANAWASKLQKKGGC